MGGAGFIVIVVAPLYQNWGASVPVGVEARFYASCSSTNTLAAEYARSGAQSPCWFIAGEQTEGRGRMGRSWESGAGNLYASLTFKPNIRPAEMAALPFIVALAARDSFIALGAPSEIVRCKWPNDILLNEKKACGVLIESSAKSADTVEYVVIGIGMNLVTCPEQAIFPVTSLKQELGIEATPKRAIEILSQSLKKRLEDWNLNTFHLIGDEWTQNAWGIGQWHTINTASERFEAKLVRLDHQGGLLVQLASGKERTIVAADIFPTNRN